jgi:hypothetical protein
MKAKRGLLVVAAVVVAAGVAAAALLLAGGADDGGTAAFPAEQLLSPDQFDTSSQDLAQTIANLNAAQLALTDAVTAPTPPLDEEVDDMLVEVATQAMRVGELAQVLAKTAQSQGDGKETGSAAAGQYDAVAQNAYAQVLAAQELREQYAAGRVDLDRVAVTVVDFGARLWNTGVVRPGVDGNPFIPLYARLGYEGMVEAAAPVPPQAIEGLTAEGLTAPRLWIAATASSVTYTLTVSVRPVSGNFDPLGEDLIVLLLTAAGQEDGNTARRAVLARLQGYRLGDAPGVSLTTFEAEPQPDSGVYVNVYDADDVSAASLGSLPASGRVGLTVSLPRNIALAAPGQATAGFLPSFEKGTVTALYARAGSAEEIVVAGLEGDGPMAILGRTDLLGTTPVLDLQVVKVETGGLTATDTLPAYPALKVRLTLSWKSNVLPLLIACDYLGSHDTQNPTGETTLDGEVTIMDDSSAPVVHCAAVANRRVYDRVSITIPEEGPVLVEAATAVAGANQTQAAMPQSTPALGQDEADATANAGVFVLAPTTPAGTSPTEAPPAATQTPATGGRPTEAPSAQGPATLQPTRTPRPQSEPPRPAAPTAAAPGQPPATPPQPTQPPSAPPSPTSAPPTSTSAPPTLPPPTNTLPPTPFVKQVYAQGVMSITTPVWSSEKALSTGRLWQLCISGSMTGYLNSDASQTPVTLGPLVFNGGGHITGAPQIASNGCVTFEGLGSAVVISCGHFSATAGSFTFVVWDLGPL